MSDLLDPFFALFVFCYACVTHIFTFDLKPISLELREKYMYFDIMAAPLLTDEDLEQ